MFGRTRHIVWDWNGTLLGDSKALVTSVILAFELTGLGSITFDDHQRDFMRPISEFFDKLAGRPLERAEHDLLQINFNNAYTEQSNSVGLTVNAMQALTSWQQDGNFQSLLSMCPDNILQQLVLDHAIGDSFVRVDGYRGMGPDTKQKHLIEHLDAIGPTLPDYTTLIGDTVDDALAAKAAGIRCVIYHCGQDALESITHFKDLGVPVAKSLMEAISIARE